MSYLVLLLLCCLPLSAQTLLDEIEVEAVKDVDRFTFATSETISTKELSKEPMGLVSPSLSKIPGVIAAQNGGPGGRVAFFIRGTESRHVSFTLDNLKINDTSNTDRQFDAAFLTSPFVKSITVHKGPQAVLFGSDALGGMVDIKTRKGEMAPETRFVLNVGSFGTIDSSLSNDWVTGENQGSLTVSRFHTDGISRINEKRYNATEKDSTDITQLTSSSRHHWASKVETDILISYLHGKAEQDGFARDNNHDYSRNDQYIVQQKTNYEISKTQAISLRNGLNRHQRLNDSLTSKKEFFNGDLIQNELIYLWEIGNWDFLSGLTNEHENANTNQMDKAFDLNSVFLQSSWSLKDFKFHLGGRIDDHSKYGTFYTGSSGVGYRGFTLQYSQGYKAPSLYQLYGPESFGAPVGNPNLVPETNHAWELSWNEKNEEWEAGVSLFQNRLANQFTYSFTQGYLNQQRFMTEGIELSGKLIFNKSEIYSSFTHLEFKDNEEVVLRRPNNAATVSFSYFPVESLELNVTGTWYSARKDYGAVEITKLNSYEVVDLGVNKTWEKDEVGLSLKNIFDREYENIYGFSVMPRSVFGHYGHNF